MSSGYVSSRLANRRTTHDAMRKYFRAPAGADPDGGRGKHGRCARVQCVRAEPKTQTDPSAHLLTSNLTSSVPEDERKLGGFVFVQKVKFQMLNDVIIQQVIIGIIAGLNI